MQIYARAMALTYVVVLSLDIVPDNQKFTLLDRTVPLAVYGKPGICCYVTAASAIIRWGKLMHHWVIGIVGKFPKSGTLSSIGLQTWFIFGRITKCKSTNGIGVATNNMVTSGHIHPNPFHTAVYLSLEYFNLVIYSSLAM
jgi:hypothetical protein